MFKFGVSEKDITPQIGMGIPGYYSTRIIDGVLDRLYAKAMAFENGGETVITIVCDTINLDRDDVRRIRLGVNAACGVREDCISVSATHIHTGGPTWDWFAASYRDPVYITMLVDGAVAAAADAFKKMRPAKIGFAKTELLGYSWIRRYMMKNGRVLTNPGVANPEIDHAVGTPDNTLTIGKVTDCDGKTLAFISNYGVHLDMVCGSEVSADYPGELSRLVKEKYGDDVVSVFFTGPCGNTNDVNTSDADFALYHKDIYKRTGRAIFDALCGLEGKIALSADAVPMCQSRHFAAELRVPTPEYVAVAEKLLRGEDAVFEGYGIENYPPNQKYMIAQATLAAYHNTEHTCDVEVMALVLGDSAIVLWPAEVFVEYGKALREQFADKNVIISELSNGSFGCYLPTEDAIEQGGYEPTITGAQTPHPRVGAKLVSSAAEILRSLDL